MGLFTNRKRDEESGNADTASMLARFAPPTATGLIDGEPDAALTDSGAANNQPDFAAIEVPPFGDIEAPPFSDAGTIDTSTFEAGSFEAGTFDAATFDNFSEVTSEQPAESSIRSPELAGYSPELVELRNIEMQAAELSADTAMSASLYDDTDRQLDDRPPAHVGNVEIDVPGLLDMLGIDQTATLTDISEARQRFSAEHEPNGYDDADAAEIKEKIRREVNTAYALFRLTHAG